MIPVLLEGMKEQQSIIETQQADNAALKVRIEKLETLVADLVEQK